MKSIRTAVASMCLSLLLAGNAVAAGETDKVNINTADAGALASALHNVGLAKAEAIVAYREEHGPFKSAEQLAQVAGIGMRTVENNIDRIEVGATAARTAPSTSTAAAKGGSRPH